MNNKINNQREMELDLIHKALTHKTNNALVNIQFALSQMNGYLSRLIGAYHIAKAHNLITDNISTKCLDELPSDITNAMDELIQMDFFLNMFAFISQNYQYEMLPRESVSIKTIWDAAIAEYSLAKKEFKKHIKKISSDDFKIFVDPILMKQVFFVLLYNTFSRIKDDDWSLTAITTKQDGQYNCFYLRSTGCFLPDAGEIHLLDKVYLANKKTWLGCFAGAEVIKKFGGEMMCFEDRNETVFCLKLPAINDA